MAGTGTRTAGTGRGPEFVKETVTGAWVDYTPAASQFQIVLAENTTYNETRVYMYDSNATVWKSMELLG